MIPHILSRVQENTVRVARKGRIIIEKLHLRRVDYRELNGKQKEIYNFQKVAAKLADYGRALPLKSDITDGPLSRPHGTV